MAQFETLSAYLGRLIIGETLALIVLWSLIAWLFRKPIARRANLRKWQYLWTSLSFIGILSFTLRMELNGNDPIPWVLNAKFWSEALEVNANWALNVLLFVPSAFILVVIGRRPWPVLLGLVGLSATIESIQQLSLIGVADPGDWVANSLGAAVGVFLAEIVILTNIMRTKKRS